MLCVCYVLCAPRWQPPPGSYSHARAEPSSLPAPLSACLIFSVVVAHGRLWHAQIQKSLCCWWAPRGDDVSAGWGTVLGYVPCVQL